MDAYIRKNAYPGVEALCQLFEIQPRTVHQDIKELRERFHLDIRFDRHRAGYYNATPGKRLPPLEFTPEQAMLTLASIEMFCHFGGASFTGMFAPVIDAVMTDRHASIAKELSEKLAFDAAPVKPVSASIFVQLLDACIRCRPVTLGLSEPMRDNPCSIDPLRLLFKTNSWWLLARADSKELEIPLASIVAAMIK